MGPEIERMPGGWHSIASMKGIRATELALLLMHVFIFSGRPGI
jgi:hypothetical protein